MGAVEKNQQFDSAPKNIFYFGALILFLTTVTYILLDCYKIQES